MQVRCATCDKPVDRLSWWVDECSKEIHITAECHGDKASTVIDQRTLLPERVRDIESQVGVAFIRSPKIGNIK